MIELFKKAKASLLKGLDYAIILLMASLVVVVVLQVVFRGLKISAPWTSETAEFLLIWVTLLGASAGFIKKCHLGVDYFVNKLGPKARCVVDITINGLVGFFAVYILMFGGGTIVERLLRFGQTSPALGLKMGYVYMALPICGFFILLVSIETIMELVNKLLKGETKDASASEAVKEA